jgi:adaptin ear-binding coat-associated protein 1/2
VNLNFSWSNFCFVCENTENSNTTTSFLSFAICTNNKMRRVTKKAKEPKEELQDISTFEMPANSGIPPPPLPASAANSDSDAAIFLQSLQDPEIIERVRATIPNAHVFKLPPRQSATIGWRGADWKEKVWQGTVKVVERGELTAVLLVDKTKGSIFAVCPVKEGAVDRCVDSSRYFVLRIENANGRHMFIGVAFNERNDAFDFNTSLEDSRREREQEANPIVVDFGPPKDYSIKAGEKIKVSIPKPNTNKYGEGK